MADDETRRNEGDADADTDADADADSDADTDLETGATGDTGGPPPAPAVWITDHEIDCYINACTWIGRTNIQADYGHVFIALTGDAAGAEGPWGENHPMVAESDRVTVTLFTGSPRDGYAPDSNTWFDGYYINDPDGDQVSYILRVYNADGVSDCVAWGHDPQGLVDGAYNFLNDPENPDEIEGCRVEL